MGARILTTLSAVMSAAMFAAASLGIAAVAQAGWDLDADRSAVQFMSVKNASIAELHHFKSLAGGIADDGSAQVVIDLDSVETLIPIRNERMRKLLFDTLNFPSATISAAVPEGLTSMKAGESRAVDLEVSVNLHGVVAPIPAKAQVTRLADGGLQVALSEPLLVKASDFNLEDGIGALREVAGLTSISTAVPVTATLVFTPGS